ncbi:MAG: glucose-6-phosphate isomerase [Gammaproteobacteria bacterium]
MAQFNTLAEWQQLHAHSTEIQSLHLRDLFADEPHRFPHYSIHAAGIFLDYSRNLITDQTCTLLLQLAHARQLEQHRTDLFAGRYQPTSHPHPILYWQLRDSAYTQKLNSHSISQQTLISTMLPWAEQLRAEQWLGYTHKPIRHIVNVGIGGSELGVKMTTRALAAYSNHQLTYDCLSNIDCYHLNALLQRIDLERTLFIVCSKSFGTLETINHLKYLLSLYPESSQRQQHFIAVTAKPQRAIEQGITASRILQIDEWVNGRFSICSAMGFMLAIAIGEAQFKQFLAGAYAMDEHFRNAPLPHNMPVIMALLDIWYSQFFGSQTQAILPYEDCLEYFPAYLQQASMESLGKQVNNQGEHVSHVTGNIVWGGLGNNGQHAYMQLLHQGHHLVPADFIVAQEDLPNKKVSHNAFDVGQSALCTSNSNDNKTPMLATRREILLTNCISQAQALMQGRTLKEAYDYLQQQGYTAAAIEQLAPHLIVKGNRPSNILFTKQITPHSLGALIALYDHKIFTTSALLDIQAYDQWGVELGKSLTQSLAVTDIIQQLCKQLSCTKT